MPSTTTPTSSLSPGDLVDLGEHCPPRCVTWDENGTCWGLVRTRGKARRPETVPYRVMAPVDDDEAWIAGTAVAEPQPAAAGTPPPPRPPTVTAVAADPPPGDPVELVRAVFGDVQVIASAGELARLVTKLLDSYGRRDPAALDEPAWKALATAGSDDGTALAAAARGVLGWCAEHDPTRLGLGGWKGLAQQVEAFEGTQGGPGVKLVRYVPPTAPAA